MKNEEKKWREKIIIKKEMPNFLLASVKSNFHSKQYVEYEKSSLKTGKTHSIIILCWLNEQREKNEHKIDEEEEEKRKKMRETERKKWKERKQQKRISNKMVLWRTDKNMGSLDVQIIACVFKICRF